MKAEIKNIRVTLGEKEFEFTMEELQALRKAIDQFLPKEKINNIRSNDTLINEDFKKLLEKYEKESTPVIPRPYYHPPYDPNQIWCSVNQINPFELEKLDCKNEYIQ